MTTATTTRQATMDCPRCGGTGRYTGHGVCYRCHGRGTVKYRQPSQTVSYPCGPDYTTMGRSLTAEVRSALLSIVSTDEDIAVGAAHWLAASDEDNAREWLTRVAPGWEDWT